MRQGLILLGFRGAGKTSCGRLWAEKQKQPFIDTDTILEKRVGQKTYEFIAEKGETAFRDMERQLLQELSVQGWEPSIYALGGGTLEDEKSYSLVCKAPLYKVYLEVPAAILWERLSTMPERLQVGALDTAMNLEKLLRAREGKYRDLADIVLPNVTECPEDCIANLEARLKEL